ncbi:hypothetical protein V8D89_005529 [Ganoderma adspersum]
MRVFKELGHCIREAYLQVDDLGWHELVDSMPKNPPLLKYLTIDAEVWTGQKRTYKDGEHYFGGLAHGLRRIYLSCAPFLPTDHFPNLTHLIASGYGTFPVRIIRSVLSNMPRLQIAILDIEIGECDGDSGVIVQLPHLRQLELKDIAPLSTTALLPMIKFPSACFVQISKQMSKTLVSIVSLLYTQNFAQNLTRLRIMPNRAYNKGDEDQEDNLYFLEFLNDAGTSGVSIGIYEPYSGLWTADDRGRVTDTLVDFLSSSVGAELVSNVRELWVHMWTDLVNDRLLAVIPPIDTLGLVLARPPYVRTEIPESIGQLTEDGTFIHCPDLTSLCVYTCGAEDVDRARMVATARKDAGCPLEKLAIECEQEKSGVRSQALELEGLVQELLVTIGEKRRPWWKPCVIPERKVTAVSRPFFPGASTDPSMSPSHLRSS